MKCCLIFSTNFVLNMSHSKNNAARSSWKAPLMLVRLLQSVDFLDRFSNKNTQIQNFTKILLVKTGAVIRR
jgi:hypothetical protein